MPSTPRPSRFWNDSTAGSSPSSLARRARRWRGRSGARRRPRARRRAAAARRDRRRAATMTSRTCMRPVVTVPVLSSTIVSTRRVDSSTSGPLIRMPSCAPRPVPTSSAVGVARPSAQGQAMISTATAVVIAKAALAPPPSQKPSVATARAMTIGTKIAETRSASRCTGALPVWASVTSRPICASAVSAPTLVARTTRRPPTLTVAPATSSPRCFSTGIDSPVRSAWSTAEEPSSTMPSVATFSPGRTTKRSPTCSSPIGTRRSLPSASSTATSLAPSSSRAVERSAGAALGARLEVAAGQDRGS